MTNNGFVINPHVDALVITVTCGITYLEVILFPTFHEIQTAGLDLFRLKVFFFPIHILATYNGLVLLPYKLLSKDHGY